MPQQPDKPSVPPLSTPVRSFNQPPHIEHQERTWVEQVDITASSYVEVPRGTLYSAIVGADVRLVAAHPTMYLLREIIDPRVYPYANRIWGFGEAFTDKSIGQGNLIPEKYRRLIKTVETDQPVAADYDFPSGLTGDQAEIKLQQETIDEARLHIINEIIETDEDPLLGHEDSEFGSVSIRESVVTDGTAIDAGINVLKSTVTPLGNGKSIKITASYDQDIATLDSLRKSIGQDNLIPAKYRRLIKHTETDTFVAPTYDFPSGLSGDQTQIQLQQETETRARLKTTEEVIDVNADPLRGQTYDEQFDVAIPFTETLEDSGTSLGQNRKTIEPTGAGKDIVRAVNPAALAAVFDAYVLSFPTTTSIDIPDILTGITIMTESSVGSGTSTEQVDAATWSGPHSLTFPLRAEAQGSAAISGEVIPHMIPFYGVRREVTNYLFFLPAPVTAADITAKLHTLTGLDVTNWADFKPGYITIVLASKRQSAQASAGVTIHDSAGDASSASMISHSTGTSKELGMAVKTVRIPPTLHGDITLVDEDGVPIASEIITSASVAAHIVGLVGTISIASFDATVTADASLRIITAGLEATSGPTSLPDTGLLIVRTDAAPYKYGYVRISAEVIDASTL